MDRQLLLALVIAGLVGGGCNRSKHPPEAAAASQNEEAADTATAGVGDSGWSGDGGGGDLFHDASCAKALNGVSNQDDIRIEAETVTGNLERPTENDFERFQRLASGPNHRAIGPPIMADSARPETSEQESALARLQSLEEHRRMTSMQEEHRRRVLAEMEERASVMGARLARIQRQCGAKGHHLAVSKPKTHCAARAVPPNLHSPALEIHFASRASLLPRQTRNRPPAW